MPNSSLVKIGESTFEECTMESIEIPSFIEEIRKWAFANSKVKIVVLPSNLIKNRAFADSNVKSVVFLPDSKLRKIEQGASKGYALDAIDILSTVEVIEEAAFENCDHLRSTVIKGASKHRKIHPSAFRGCASLESHPSIGTESAKSIAQ